MPNKFGQRRATRRSRINRGRIGPRVTNPVKKPTAVAPSSRSCRSLFVFIPEQNRVRRTEQAPGRYARTEPALVMVGHWGLRFSVTPPSGNPFVVTVVDKAAG